MSEQMKNGVIKRGKTYSYVIQDKGKTRWVGGFRTRAEAVSAREEARVEKKKGRYVSPSKVTVSEYLEQWLDTYESQLKPSTRLSYRLHVDRYIKPWIGEEQLQELTTTLIENLYSDLVAAGGKDRRKLEDGEKAEVKGLSLTTVKHVRNTLHKALACAVKDRLIVHNPADGALVPKVDDSAAAEELQVWTRAELDRFLDATKSSRFYPLWRLCCWSGLRRGELIALRWSDLDPTTGVLKVMRSRVTLGGGVVREGTPKSDRGKRSVELDDDTLATLRLWKQQQEADREDWPGEWPDHNLIFTLEDGSALGPDQTTRLFQSAVKKAGVPRIRLHDVRHTHATLLIAAGVPVKVVSERLGHSGPMITMSIYQHVLPGMQREAVQRVADAAPKTRHLEAVAS